MIRAHSSVSASSRLRNARTERAPIVVVACRPAGLRAPGPLDLLFDLAFLGDRHAAEMLATGGIAHVERALDPGLGLLGDGRWRRGSELGVRPRPRVGLRARRPRPSSELRTGPRARPRASPSAPPSVRVDGRAGARSRARPGVGASPRDRRATGTRASAPCAASALRASAPLATTARPAPSTAAPRAAVPRRRRGGASRPADPSRAPGATLPSRANLRAPVRPSPRRTRRSDRDWCSGCTH